MDEKKESLRRAGTQSLHPFVYRWHFRTAVIIALVVSTAISGCSPPDVGSTKSGAATAASPPVIPHDHSHGSRDGYLVTIWKSGVIFWNGQDVDLKTLALYLRQYAGRPKGAGRLWLEIEPGAPPRAVEIVRQMIFDSDVCAKQGCVEGDWGVERPVV